MITSWPPADPAEVARAVADSVVLQADEGARAANPYYWHRAEPLLAAVGGMDERFEGWGREDIDFVLRVQLATAFDGYADRMLHLHHPSPVRLDDGETVNAGIPLLSWRPAGPIGRLDRYCAAG